VSAPTVKRTFVEIDAELDQIADAFDRLGDGGTEEEIFAAVEAYFGDLMDERDRKLDNYARFIAQRQAYAEFRKAEADRLSALAKADLNAAKSCKDRLHWLFVERGWTKIETPNHKFAIQKNGGKVPLIIADIDPTLVPVKYQKVTVTLDNDAIRADLDGGISLPFARFGEVGSHLRIR
jgi:hypothetical protein